MKEIEKIIDEVGIITTKEIVKDNKTKTKFYNYLKNKDFEKVARGIYAPKDSWADPLLVAHKRCPSGVISHDVALYHYGLVDREPMYTTLTINSGYNVSRLKSSGIKAYFVKKELLEVGKTEVVDFFGNKIPMYNLERTICDLVRNRKSFEIQDFNTAMKTYVRKKEKNLNKLMEYAKLFRVEKIIKSYLDMLCD